jgi:hypothetical protein
MSRPVRSRQVETNATPGTVYLFAAAPNSFSLLELWRAIYSLWKKSLCELISHCIDWIRYFESLVAQFLVWKYRSAGQQIEAEPRGTIENFLPLGKKLQIERNLESA